MSLAAGQSLGRTPFLAPLGAGGICEVYRARDARLNPDVAIKVVPASVDGETLRARLPRGAGRKRS